MEVKILKIQSDQQQQRDGNWKLANLYLLFKKVFGSSEPKDLMHTINNLSTNIHPALLTAVDTCTHWVALLNSHVLWLTQFNKWNMCYYTKKYNTWSLFTDH